MSNQTHLMSMSSIYAKNDFRLYIRQYTLCSKTQPYSVISDKRLLKNCSKFSQPTHSLQVKPNAMVFSIAELRKL